MIGIEIAYKIKFRSWGVTFGTIAGSQVFPLPPLLSIVGGSVLGTHEIGRIDERGVQIVASVVNK